MHIWAYLYFSWQSWFQLVIPPAQCFSWCTLHISKQGDNIQSWRTPFPIWNQSVVPCPVLIVASWPAYRFLKRQVRWCGMPISFRIFHSLLWSTKALALSLKQKYMLFWNSLAFSMIQHLRILFSAVFLHVSLLMVQLVLCQMFLMCTHPLPHFFLPDILPYLFSFSFKEKYYFQCSFLLVNCKTRKTNKNKTWILMMMEKEEVFTKDKPTSRKKRL